MRNIRLSEAATESTTDEMPLGTRQSRLGTRSPAELPGGHGRLPSRTL